MLCAVCAFPFPFSCGAPPPLVAVFVFADVTAPLAFVIAVSAAAPAGFNAACSATAAMFSAVVDGSGRTPTRCAKGGVRVVVVLPCCRTTYVNLAIVSASLSCCALKCFRSVVVRVWDGVGPRTVLSGFVWLREIGIEGSSGSGGG